MICKNCGAENENDAVFCNECGTNLSGNASEEGYAKRPPQSQELGAASTLDYKNPEPPKPDGPAPVLHHYESRRPEAIPPSYAYPKSYSPTYAAAPVAYVPAYGVPAVVHTVSMDTESGERVISKLKQFLKSPGLLVATIALTLTAVCYILCLCGISGMFDAVQRGINYAIGFNVSDVDDSFAVANIITWTVGLLLFVPLLLKIIGLWISFAQGVKPENRINVAGISIIKGVKIFEFVVFCIYVAIVFIWFIAVNGFSDLRYMSSGVAVLFFFSFFIGIGVIVWKFFYFSALFSTIDSFKDSVMYRAPSGYPSVLVAVDSFLSAAGGLFMTIFMLSPSIVFGALYNDLDYVAYDMFVDMTDGFGNFSIFEDFLGSMKLISFSCVSWVILSVVASVAFGVITIIYRNRLSYIRYER